MRIKQMISAAVLTAVLGLGAAAWSADAPTAPTLPSTGAWGFDLDGRDLKAKPGDDFFRYAGGAYQDKLVIPEDRASFSPRAASALLTEFRIREILETAAAKADLPAASVEGKIGAYYASFMDEERIERLGATPLAADLKVIREARSRSDLARLMGTSNETFQSALFAVGVGLDAKDVEHNVTYMSQAGLGMPDRDYYLDAKFAEQKTAYEAYVARMLTLAGWPDPARRAKEIVAFETRVAEASWTKVQQRDADATYNATTLAELKKTSPGFDWDAFMGGAKLGGAKKIVISEKTAFPKLAALYGAADLETLRAWQVFHLVDNASPYLSSAFVDAAFDFHGKVLNGQPQQRERWKRAVSTVSGDSAFASFGSLGWAVGQVYTDKYFPPESKAKVEALVADLKAAFRVRINKLDWMSPATKAAALKKLDTYKIKVGYPDKPRDYSGVVIRRDDLYGNVLRAAAGDWAFNRAKLGAPVDRDEWFMTPQTNNAYNGGLNDIVFPAAILTPPIFNPDADPAINYGAVGGVIGHEFTHGFDDQGRKFDWRGELKDWWTEADAATFKSRAAILGAQYSSYEPLPGAKVNGDLTMGENIADLGGLTLALEAYHISLHGRPAPVLDGTTGDQRVFLGWAQAWRGKSRDAALRQQVVSDPHSPRQYRVNGVVRNMDAWYEAFGVKPGDAMYLPPEQRVRIW